ncbi:MAG TPA: lipopolysaccharide biosynthesis protein [Pseudacidobacterium sp.]|nr:lipopolysaccharide biosynthesis protein [Pseudacidobacterium sp.]
MTNTLGQVDFLRPFLNPASSLLHRTARGTVWLALMRVAEKSMALIRTLALARLLSPAEFGLFGIAVIAMNALDLFSVVGLKAAVIQKKQEMREDLDTAWTVLLIQALVNTLLLCATSELVAHFFHQPRAALLIRTFSAAVLLEGFVNIGIVYFDRDLRFLKQCQFVLTSAACDLAVALVVAYLTRSVFALAAGTIAGKIVRVTSSYLMQSYRPRFRIKKDNFSTLFRFGKWMFLSTMLQFVLFQGDNIFVGRVLGAAALGLYSVAFSIGNLTRTDIGIILQRALFPALARLQNDRVAGRAAYLKVTKATTMLVMPISCGIGLMASDFVHVTLGPAWLGAINALRMLSVAGLFNALMGNAGVMLRSKGDADAAVVGEIWYLITGALLIYPAGRMWGITGVAVAVAVGAVGGWLRNEATVLKKLGLTWKNQWHATYANILATLTMAAVIVIVRYSIPWRWHLGALASLPIIGVVVYIFTILIVWRLESKFRAHSVEA